MNKTHFDTDWQNWIKTNVAAGRDKNGIFKILLDEGFDYLAIAREMCYMPSQPLDGLVNPFHAQSARFDATQMFIPNARRVDTGAFELHVLDDFLNPSECALYDDDDFMSGLDARVCRMLGLDVAYSDDLTLRCMAHDEAFAMPEVGVMGALLYRVVLCLDAGEMMFDDTTRVALKRGMGLAWRGNVLPRLISSAPCKVLVKDFYEFAYDGSLNPPMRTKEINEHVPNYTRTGFARSRLSDELFAKITQFYNDNLTNIGLEFVEGDFIYHAQGGAHSSVLIDLSADLRQEIHDALRPEMAAWCGQDLEPTFVYGIRVYLNQAVLRTHRDRYETHIISAIINVAQDVEEDWPLLIEDNDYRTHQVLLKPGEVVFYEGARLTHGRPTPLHGRAFANIFCHFKPINYVPLLL